ncbi:transposase [Vibrio sp. TH_r3]|uniref:transposase n=1 Tax=Vibrio sp. TH_r3 TaxID=3082084 RepID=UPI002953D931|nr:transposase [Vibrio sp. TH_r3]MDV7102943.1 transposase [Vibrio sp. TH_r3]
MTTARKQLISLEATAYYHCVSRCVRHSFLCGFDRTSNINYEHRREWVEHKIQALTYTYCIDICAYAVMHNHYHLVVHINRDKANALSQLGVVQRWQFQHKLPDLIQRWLNHQLTSQAEQKKCHEIIEIWRTRLWSLSWFMKELNYDIACKVNQEDQCTGHFWESRFKSQALLDENALAAAMTYVDLNPIRSGVAKTVETSEYTSIKLRLKSLNSDEFTPPCLHPFIGQSDNKMQSGLPFKLLDYLELVDWTARQFRENRASMDETLPPILQRLNINQQNWLHVCSRLEQKRATAIGSANSLILARTAFDRTKIHLYKLE